MEDYRVDELIEKFERFMQTLDNNPEASKQFLQRAGILDNDGEFEEPYKNLCTPQEPA